MDVRSKFGSKSTRIETNTSSKVGLKLLGNESWVKKKDQLDRKRILVSKFTGNGSWVKNLVNLTGNGCWVQRQEAEVTSSISGTKFNDGFQSKLNNISLSGINLGQIIQNGIVDLLSWELGQYRGQVLFIVGQGSLNFFFQPKK